VKIIIFFPALCANGWGLSRWSGERSGGKAERGSENKTPFVAAVSVDDEGHPLRVKLTPVPGFTLKAITD